jgi:hypothetical protein
MSVVSRLLFGGLKGGLYGLLGGLILGGAGAVVAPPIEYEKIMVWHNRFGKKTRFTNLVTVSILKEDLLTIFQSRLMNNEAYDEAFRNIQSAITVYHPIKMEIEPAEIMSATRMTNYMLRACKALEAVHMSVRMNDAVQALKVEKAAMNIQLSMEECINFVREKSKGALPTM